MSRVLASTVVLVDEDGQPVVLMAGTVPTDEQAAQISNPKAWKSHDDDHEDASEHHDSHDDEHDHNPHDEDHESDDADDHSHSSDDE